MTYEVPHRAAMGPGDGAAVARTARVSWLADPPHGSGQIHAGSDAFTELPVAFDDSASRDAVTTPGELLTVATASAAALILARLLDLDGTPATELTVTAAQSFGAGWHRLESTRLRVIARVPGTTPESLEATTQRAIHQLRASLGLRGEEPMAFDIELR